MIATLFAEQAKAADNSLLGYIIAGLSILITPLLSFFAAKQASKASEKKAAREAATADKATDVTSWDKLVVSLQNELKRLNDRVEGLEKEGKENRGRIADLEAAVRRGDTKYRIAIQYIRDVIAWTKLAFKSDAVPPVFPPEIAPDLNMTYTDNKPTQGE